MGPMALSGWCSTSRSFWRRASRRSWPRNLNARYVSQWLIRFPRTRLYVSNLPGGISNENCFFSCAIFKQDAKDVEAETYGETGCETDSDAGVGTPPDVVTETLTEAAAGAETDGETDCETESDEAAPETVPDPIKVRLRFGTYMAAGEAASFGGAGDGAILEVCKCLWLVKLLGGCTHSTQNEFVLRKLSNCNPGQTFFCFALWFVIRGKRKHLVRLGDWSDEHCPYGEEERRRFERLNHDDEVSLHVYDTGNMYRVLEGEDEVQQDIMDGVEQVDEGATRRKWGGHLPSP